MKRILDRTPGGVAFLLVLVVVGFVVWGSRPQPATARALEAMVSDAFVQVETTRWITFTPAAHTPRAGLILYPGGRVDPRAYAPLARQIAARGYLVVIVPMPLSLAALAPDAALEVMAAHPSITSWAVGGHSLGGAMAARFALTHPQSLDGLVLWAAYPAETDDLSSHELIVTSVFGTLDGLTSGQEIDASRLRLPATTRWVAIQGGNHAQFGDYGPQAGDNPATISASQQQALAAAATIWVLKAILEVGT